MKADARTKTDVLSTLKLLNDAFRQQDVDKATALFSDDPEVSFIASEGGETAVGKAELRTLFKELFSRPEAYSWNRTTTTISAAGDAAWAVAHAKIQVHKNRKVKRYPYRLTCILEKQANTWVIVHFHGSEPMEE